MGDASDDMPDGQPGEGDPNDEGEEDENDQEADDEKGKSGAGKSAPKLNLDFNPDEIKTLDTNYLEKMGEEETTKKKKKKRMSRKEKRERKRLRIIEETKIKMRDHLERELVLSKNTVAKFKDDWDELIKSVKIVEMKQDLQEWSNKVNRVIEMKDSMVKNMLTDMDHTMELSNKAHSQFIEVLKFYNGVHASCTEIIKKCYEDQANEMIYNLQMDLHAQHGPLEEKKIHFEQKLHALSMKATYNMEKDKEVFDIMKDTIMGEHIVQRYEMRDRIAKQMRQMQKDLCDFYDDLKSTIETDKYERYSMLIEKHKVFEEDKAKVDKTELMKLQELQQWQQKLLGVEMKMSKKINYAHQENIYFLEVRNALLREMHDTSKFTYEQIKAVAVGSHELLKKYRKIKHHGELILSLAVRCRKLQTQNEKVFFDLIDHTLFNKAKEEMVEYYEFTKNTKCPGTLQEEAFYPLKRPELYDIDVVRNIFKTRTLELKCHLDLTDQELKTHLELFENFWRRQALVEAEVIILRKERKRLLYDNKKYTEYIKSLGFTAEISKLRECVQVKQMIPSSTRPCITFDGEPFVTKSFLEFPGDSKF